MKKPTLSLRLCAISLGWALAMPASAHTDLSEASALSMLPVAVSVAAPVALLSAGATLTVVAVQASAEGTAWVLERASDGARMTLRFSGEAARASAVVAGTVVSATVVGAGTVLSVAGQAICFVPNAIGRALTHHEPLAP